MPGTSRFEDKLPFDESDWVVTKVTFPDDDTAKVKKDVCRTALWVEGLSDDGQFVNYVCTISYLSLGRILETEKPGVYSQLKSHRPAYFTLIVQKTLLNVCVKEYKNKEELDKLFPSSAMSGQSWSVTREKAEKMLQEIACDANVVRSCIGRIITEIEEHNQGSFIDFFNSTGVPAGKLWCHSDMGSMDNTTATWCNEKLKQIGLEADLKLTKRGSSKREDLGALSSQVIKEPSGSRVIGQGAGAFDKSLPRKVAQDDDEADDHQGTLRVKRSLLGNCYLS